MKGNFLARLRTLDKAHEAARAKLAHLQALASTLATPPDLSATEHEVRKAAEALAAHAALNPELAAEFAARAELAELLVEERRTARLLDTLRAAPPEHPGDAPPAPDAAERYRENADLHDKAVQASIARAVAVDAEYQAAISETPTNWLRVHRAETQAALVAKQLRTAERKRDTAYRRAETIERRYAKALARYNARAAAHARHRTDIALHTAALVRTQARIAELRAGLPEQTRAPTRRPYTPRNTPTPEGVVTLILSRFAYDPASDTVRRRESGRVVKATQIVSVKGQRIGRARLLAILAPRPEDLA